MSAKETIAVIGTVFVDIKGFADAHYDPAGRNVGKIKLVHGGVGRNVAEDVARLGGGVLFVSSADDDMLGHGVVNRLSHSKIDTRYVRFAPSAGMGLWMVINDAAGRQAGAISQMPDVKHIERIIDEHGDAIVREADHIVLEIDLNEQISRRVLDLAWMYGKQVYALPGNMEVLLRNVELLKKSFVLHLQRYRSGPPVPYGNGRQGPGGYAAARPARREGAGTPLDGDYAGRKGLRLLRRAQGRAGGRLGARHRHGRDRPQRRGRRVLFRHDAGAHARTADAQGRQGRHAGGAPRAAQHGEHRSRRKSGRMSAQRR